MNMEDVCTCSRYSFETLVQNLSMLRQVNEPMWAFELYICFLCWELKKIRFCWLKFVVSLIILSTWSIACHRILNGLESLLELAFEFFETYSHNIPWFWKGLKALGFPPMPNCHVSLLCVPCVHSLVNLFEPTFSLFFHHAQYLYPKP